MCVYVYVCAEKKYTSASSSSLFVPHRYSVKLVSTMRGPDSAFLISKVSNTFPCILAKLNQKKVHLGQALMSLYPWQEYDHGPHKHVASGITV